VIVDVKREQRETGAWLVIGIVNEGPGVPEDLLPLLFTRFAPGQARPGWGSVSISAHDCRSARRLLAAGHLTDIRRAFLS
jgi:hypothetical protein